MAIFQPYMPGLSTDQNKLVKDLFNAYIDNTQQLQWLLAHLGDDNITSLDASKIKNLTVGNLVTNTLVTQTLYAQYGRIADLTVDELSTDFERIARYKTSSLADLNYIHIYDQYIDFITESTTGATTEQLKDKDDTLLYWLDSSLETITLDVTAYPVTVYTYETKLTKMQLKFVDVDGVYTPQLWLGAGTGVGNNGKACIWKGASPNGLYLDYYHSTTGALLRAKITDAGLDFGDISTVEFADDVVFAGLIQLWVQDDEPTSAKAKDVWIDTNDYSRVDRQAFTTTGTDTVSAAEFVEFTGSSAISYTLSSTGATAGCIKKLKNSSSAVVTIIATIDGTTNMYLFPLESCELIWNGTDWRVM